MSDWIDTEHGYVPASRVIRFYERKVDGARQRFIDYTDGVGAVCNVRTYLKLEDITLDTVPATPGYYAVAVGDLEDIEVWSEKRPIVAWRICNGIAIPIALTEEGRADAILCPDGQVQYGGADYPDMKSFAMPRLKEFGLSDFETEGVIDALIECQWVGVVEIPGRQKTAADLKHAEGEVF